MFLSCILGPGLNTRHLHTSLFVYTQSFAWQATYQVDLGLFSVSEVCPA